ncbi:MAG: ribonuclease R, partial [Bacteroidales bacterium]|nr:ribonuclease R [Bacteroidales bacterium]
MAKKVKIRKQQKEHQRKMEGPRLSVKGRRSKSQEEFEGVVSLTRDGFGFVVVEGSDNDIFVSQTKLRGALNGDRVKVVVTKKRSDSRRQEGEVVKIIERSKRPHIGILTVRGNQAWAIIESARMPYDIRIPIRSPKDLPEIGGLQAADGVKVAVVVTDWPRGSMEPEGKIVDVLGESGKNDTEMHAILAEFELPYRFEPEVSEAADKISDAITKAEIARRKDYRKVTTFTIDPADAKDFDDAISFIQLDEGRYEVGIHIADVSFYVKPGDIVDKEAYNRATSVYLVDRTVPMLPENLCNKLCSLRPHEDKLCYAAIFELDDKARVLSEWYGRTVINSDYRFDYEQAQQIIETHEGPLAAEIGKLNDLATVLRKARFDHGAVNFERPEMKVTVDDEGRPIAVGQKISKESNWLIEEFMLLANKGVAEYVTRKLPKLKQPTFVYRIHETPNTEKLESLRSFAKVFGHTMGPTENTKQTVRSLNSLLKEAKGRPEESALQILALRSMARARYSTDNIGHYGLAFQYYTHFTSPIRRYPDMMVHRLLAMYTQEGAKSQDKDYFEKCCDWSSQREQIAAEAERASVKYKLIEFMQDKVGQEFEGSVSGVTEWGIYVEIEPTKIEGMVSIREMNDDYYTFDEEKYMVIGKASRRTFTLGDRVRVKVLRASLEQKLLDYQMIEKVEAEAAEEDAAGAAAADGSVAGSAAGAGTARKAAAPKVEVAPAASEVGAAAKKAARKAGGPKAP